MKIIECEQGDATWVKARSGIPTASSFHKIITPTTGKLSAQSDTYLFELVAERLLGVSLDDVTSQWMERGREMEDLGRNWYEFNRDVDVERVGFCLTDDGRAGFSPDGLIGDDGGLEIKCPSAAVHVGYMLGEAATKYRCQIQGSLWITGRKWWDFVSYNPSLTPVLIRFERDEEFIAKLSEAVVTFCGQLEMAMAEMEAKGLKAVA